MWNGSRIIGRGCATFCLALVLLFSAGLLAADSWEEELTEILKDFDLILESLTGNLTNIKGDLKHLESYMQILDNDLHWQRQTLIQHEELLTDSTQGLDELTRTSKDLGLSVTALESSLRSYERRLTINRYFIVGLTSAVFVLFVLNLF